MKSATRAGSGGRELPGWRSATIGEELDGALLVLDDGRTALVDPLEPGSATVIDLVVRVPARPGSYLLEVDMVEEGVCWFADRGSVSLRIPVAVAPRPRRYRLFAPLRIRQHDSQEVVPAPFSMHALPRDRVIAAVEEEGGQVVAVESYNPAGEGWESYRYYVTTGGTALA